MGQETKIFIETLIVEYNYLFVESIVPSKALPASPEFDELLAACSSKLQAALK
jgi:hypothetical protein